MKNKTMIIKLNNGLEISVQTYTFVDLNLETVSKETASGLVCIQNATEPAVYWIEKGKPEYYNKVQIINWNEL